MAVPLTVTLYKANDQHLEISGLADGLTGAYVNTAVVTATLLDRARVPVAGLSALALAYVAASNGVYRGLVQDAFDPPAGEGYRLRLVAVDGSNRMVIEIPARVAVRSS